MALLLEQGLRLQLPPVMQFSLNNKESILTKLFVVVFQPRQAMTAMWKWQKLKQPGEPVFSYQFSLGASRNPS
jgi:hypothetical protein